MECDFLLAYINGSQQMKKEYAEVVEHHLDTCLACQDLSEVMGGLLFIEEEYLFPIEMKTRILTKVFDEALPMM